MTLTGKQVREACELLRWDQFDLQRNTALPLSVVERALASGDGVGEILADEITLKDAFHRAGVEITSEGVVTFRKGEA